MYIYIMSQIFKTNIPNDLFFLFLKENSNVCSKYYEFNKYYFKKSVLNKTLHKFLDSIGDYYYFSKKNI